MVKENDKVIHSQYGKGTVVKVESEAKFGWPYPIKLATIRLANGGLIKVSPNHPELQAA